METGIYESIINKLIKSKLEAVDITKFHIAKTPIDKSEATFFLSQYLHRVINFAFSTLRGDDVVSKQIKLSNKIIELLDKELTKQQLEQDLIDTQAELLTAIISKVNNPIEDFENYQTLITPYTRLSQSELFTGNNAGISLETEIKKEINSSNEVRFLVSFIKWTGIRIFQDDLKRFTNNGGKLKIITTSYMGVTEAKAIDFLTSLPNTEIKISYNSNHERLHAKAYLFLRNSGFHTGYIGSSNISRSALTNGLEWNLKITTQEIDHIIEKFRNTFDTYWNDPEFEKYEPIKHKPKLTKALDSARRPETRGTVFFDIAPYPYQKEILEKLKTEREVHNRWRNLIVAATGTGKTIISAFDFKEYRQHNPNCKFLYIAHRKEILTQALITFHGILRDNNFGELLVDGERPSETRQVFASIQSLSNYINELNISSDYFDYIIIDEVHHAPANSYRSIIDFFKPKILLGLTATPERLDTKDVLSDFNDIIAAEIRLPEALNRKLLCPFQYFGITDSIDLSRAGWQGGRYVVSELTQIYTSNRQRISSIDKALKQYVTDPEDVRALGYCVSQDHAKYMAESFTLLGYRADFLVSTRNEDRVEIRERFRKKEINYLFVVDMFNEGIDIPEIDTVLFLRPTESLTVFLQQLGRGLRLSENKDCLTVLDFIGNSRSEYDFANKFRALVGKTNTPIEKEVEDNFPHLPLGCSIIIERVAKEHILRNIKQAVAQTRNNLVYKIKNFKHQSTLPLTLKNFITFYQIPLQYVYKHGGWSRLCVDAGETENFTYEFEKQIISGIQKKWLACSSREYFLFILKLAKTEFRFNEKQLNPTERKMTLMLHYDFWDDNSGFTSLDESIKNLGEEKQILMEILEVLEILIDRTDHMEYDYTSPHHIPLKVHSRYTRDQILSAFNISAFGKKSSNREGVATSKSTNSELLFVTLHKSDKEFSPTTQYQDFAINQNLFHWQSQNSASERTSKGQSYILHQKSGKRILLFVRERKKDEYGNTMGYVFLGEAEYVDHDGEKPMNIRWDLKEPLPPYLWTESAKLAVG